MEISVRDIFTDINSLVAAFLKDVADRPAPLEAENTLAKIRHAVGEGNATIAMAMTIIALFPNDDSHLVPPVNGRQV